MAAGLAASSAPRSQPGPELLNAAQYPGAEQTTGLIETLHASLEVPPCLLQPQPNGSQPVTECPLSEGTLQLPACPAVNGIHSL